MNSFSEILKQFSPKHKAWVLFMLLVFTVSSFLGGKYIESRKTIADVLYVDSVTTAINKNCELQKQELLNTQSIMQGQINDVLTDLITLRQLVIKNNTITNDNLASIKKINKSMSLPPRDCPKDVDMCEPDIKVVDNKVTPIVIKDNKYQKLSLEKLDHLIEQTQKLIK